MRLSSVDIFPLTKRLDANFITTRVSTLKGHWLLYNQHQKSYVYKCSVLILILTDLNRRKFIDVVSTQVKEGGLSHTSDCRYQNVAARSDDSRSVGR